MSISAAKLIKALEKLGFSKVRTKGSHYIYQHADGRWTAVPYHAQDIAQPLLGLILHQTKLKLADIRRALR